MPLPPLSPHVPIVDERGRPTPEFLQWWQQQRTANATNTLDTALKVSAALDEISGVQGSLLYRDSSNWNALAPGVAGRFLKTQGAGANPVWDVSSGGATVFTGLTDVPASYTGHGGKTVAVKAAEDGLEFIAGGGGGVISVLGGPTANTGSFGSRGGRLIPEQNCTITKLYFKFTPAAGVDYRASIVTLDGSNTVLTIVAEVTVSGLSTTPTYQTVEFDFGTAVNLTAGTSYGIICTRLVTSGSSSWSMAGTSLATVIPDLGITSVDTYLRATVNLVTVGQTYSSGLDSYWWGVLP